MEDHSVNNIVFSAIISGPMPQATNTSKLLSSESIFKSKYPLPDAFGFIYSPFNLTAFQKSNDIQAMLVSMGPPICHWKNGLFKHNSASNMFSTINFGKTYDLRNKHIKNTWVVKIKMNSLEKYPSLDAFGLFCLLKSLF